MKLLLICAFFISSFMLTHAHKWMSHYIPYAYSVSCALDDGTIGVCKLNCNQEEFGAWAPYKICYFRYGAAYICCKEKDIKTTTTTTTTASPKPEPLKQRTAERVCGYPGGELIVAGVFTAPKEFPYMVALGWQQPFMANEYDYKCGGVLIWHAYVLTAAHCAIVNGLEPDVVLIGGVDLNDPNGSVVKVKRVIVHPAYDSGFIYDDIALLELQWSASDEFACLWTQRGLNNDPLTAIGYGHISFGGVGSERLLKANFNAVANEVCGKFYDSDEDLPNGIMDTQLCAKDPNNRSDTCQGDSGGPLMKQAAVFDNETKNWFVVGITSYGTGCAFAPPGIYTRVSAYIDWIESQVWPNGVSF